MIKIGSLVRDISCEGSFGVIIEIGKSGKVLVFWINDGFHFSGIGIPGSGPDRLIHEWYGCKEKNMFLKVLSK
ncbi:MAG: hypothetical protein Q8P81_03585 [Nanoarchaeota archaeon]|nr:hypothetical protein [Nanoarchaeota archaeon]